jgi:hypothetical protein
MYVLQYVDCILLSRKMVELEDVPLKQFFFVNVAVFINLLREVLVSEDSSLRTSEVKRP